MSKHDRNDSTQPVPVAPSSVSTFPDAHIVAFPPASGGSAHPEPVSSAPAHPITGSHSGHHTPIEPKPPVGTNPGSPVTFGPNPPGRIGIKPKPPVGNKPLPPPITMGPNPPGQLPIKTPVGIEPGPPIIHVPEPPVTIDPGSPIVKPIIKPIHPPIEHQPTTGLQRGTVAAADGSTISWSTASDGTITATGSNQKLVMTRTADATGRTQRTAYFDNGTTTPYFTVESTRSASSTSLINQYSAGATSLSITLTGLTGAAPAASVVLTRPNQQPLKWAGTLKLTKPPSPMAVPAGWPTDTFAAPRKKASYFDVAIEKFPAASPPAKALIEPKAALDSVSPLDIANPTHGQKQEAGEELSALVAVVIFVGAEVVGAPFWAGLILAGAGTYAFEKLKDNVIDNDPPTDPTQGQNNTDQGTGSTDPQGFDPPIQGNGQGTPPTNQTPPQQNGPESGPGTQGADPVPAPGTDPPAQAQPDPSLPIAGATSPDPNDPTTVSTGTSDSTGNPTDSDSGSANPIASEPTTSTSNDDNSSVATASSNDSASSSSDSDGGGGAPSDGGGGGGPADGGGTSDRSGTMDMDLRRKRPGSGGPPVMSAQVHKRRGGDPAFAADAVPKRTTREQ